MQGTVTGGREMDDVERELEAWIEAEVDRELKDLEPEIEAEIERLLNPKHSLAQDIFVVSCGLSIIVIAVIAIVALWRL